MTMTCSIAASDDGARRIVPHAASVRITALTTARRRPVTNAPSADLDELLETPQAGRDGTATTPVGERDLAHVDVAPRVDGEAVRGDELARLQSGRTLAQPRQSLALAAVDADAGPDVRHVEVDAEAAPDLADVEPSGRALEEQARRPMHVGPLRLVLAVAVEDLDAMVLAIGDVHPALGVAADVVRDVELARVGAGLAPRVEPAAVRRIRVHARVAVAVGDVEIALRRQRRVRAAV